MFEKLDSIVARYEEVSRMLGDAETVADPARYAKVAKEHAELTPLVQTYERYRRVLREEEESAALLETEDDAGMKELAREELEALGIERKNLENELRLLLLPKDPDDEKNVILEIRAGTGGEEAALFAADLFRMFSRYAETRGWKVDITDQSQTDIGGFKEIIAIIEGKEVFSRLKYESGVHRVQRVPSTEAQGRIHTSAVTVAVMPEADEVEVTINPDDLRIDVFRSTGPGGQSVNTTDSAVRITHLPTKLVVSCQDEKSQHKNRAKALRVLQARLYDLALTKQHAERSELRRSQVGSGDRSERIRTYNFPQNRVTDHRVGLTSYNLDRILEGELDELVEPLIIHYQAEAMKSAGTGA